MQKYKSDHYCGFCKKEGIAKDLTNSTNLDIELVINGKFILTFPSMIMHYLTTDTKKSHGWDNPWQPPAWFVDAILAGGKIDFDPTPMQRRMLPVYKVGYLTTKDQIKKEYDGEPPQEYQMGSRSEIGPNTIVDTHGGDANFLNATTAQFAAPSERFLNRMDSLCTSALSQYLDPSKAVQLNLRDIADFDPQLPKQVVLPLQFDEYVRLAAHLPYSETKDYKDSINYTDAGEAKSIKTQVLVSPHKVSHSDYLKLFRAQCYLPIEGIGWHRNGDNFEAKIDISIAGGALIDYQKILSFEEMKKCFLEVFNELGIKSENIIFDSKNWAVRVPSLSFRHLEEKGVQIEAKKQEAHNEVNSSTSLFTIFGSTSQHPIIKTTSDSPKSDASHLLTPRMTKGDDSAKT